MADHHNDASTIRSDPCLCCDGQHRVVTSSPTPRNQLDAIYEYARLRGLRQVFSHLPPRDSYIIDAVSADFAVRDGRLAYLPRRIQLGANSKCTVWAYLRLQNGSLAGGTEFKLYAETESDLYPIKLETIHLYPFREPFNFFSTPEASYTSRRQFKYLIRYLFLELNLMHEVFTSTSSALEHIAGALRKIQTYYELRSGTEISSSTPFRAWTELSTEGNQVIDDSRNPFNGPLKPTASRSGLRHLQLQRKESPKLSLYNNREPADPSLNTRGTVEAAALSRLNMSSRDYQSHQCGALVVSTEDTACTSLGIHQTPARSISPKKEGDEMLSQDYSAALRLQGPSAPTNVCISVSNDINRIMSRIEADESEDEHLSNDLSAALEYLELRKRKRDQALDYLMQHRAGDLKEYLKKRKH